MIQLTKDNYHEYLFKLNNLSEMRGWTENNVFFNIWTNKSENILLVMHIQTEKFKVYQEKYKEMLSNARQGNVSREYEVAYVATNFFILERIIEEFPELEGNHILVDVNMHEFNVPMIVETMNKHKYYTFNGKYDAEDVKLITEKKGEILKKYYFGKIEKR